MAIILIISFLIQDNTDFNITLYNQLLKNYVNQDGFVNYAALKKNDAKNLDFLVNQIAKKSPQSHPNDYSDKEKLVYWINCYNVLILKTIVDEYPIKSIKDIYLIGAMIWTKNHLVGGKKLSFNAIEHDILRKEFKEERIHFAINCASFGCPKLQNSAFTISNVDSLLEEGLNSFFATKRHFNIDDASKTIYVSSILDWFKEDFYSAEKGENILDYILKKSKKEIANRIKIAKDSYQIKYIEYDWALNKQ